MFRVRQISGERATQISTEWNNTTAQLQQMSEMSY